MLKSPLKRRISEKLKTLVLEGAGSGFQLVLGFKNESLGCFTAGVADFKNRRVVRRSTRFDLASLTKILVVIDLLIKAHQENKISDLNSPLKTWFPFFSSDLKNRTILDVLNHRSGLPPIFEYTNEIGEELPSRDDRIRFFLRKIDETYLPHPSDGAKIIYSDVGFMLLGLLLEQAYGRRLQHLYENRGELSYGPISFHAEWLSWLTGSGTVAAIQSLDAKPKWLKGVVQDPRAQWLGGDAGHAGLFGTADGVENWGRELFMAYHGKSLHQSDRIVRKFIDFDLPLNGSYLNGFDTPSREGISQSGSQFSNTTIGHLGYSGCSFWMDIEKGIRVTLLSHRFQPGIEPDKLKKLRPAFHDWLHAEVFSKLRV
ncbi:MAG: beta-lactamase [Bacteriovoracaceae bacterium]|nr:beta-lactamase [Bacteriovoracaceae bacterium]